MTLAEKIITACWIILLIYWLVNARSVKKTQEKVGGIGGNWHYLLAVIAFTLIQDTSYPFSIRLFTHSTVTDIVSMLCGIGGLYIAIIARRTLAENWSGTVTFKKNHELITKGIYHYVRHPIYTGVLVMFLGTAFLIETFAAFTGFVFLFLTFWVKLRQEEKLMTKHFPKDYPAYKKSVKALIPFVF